MTYGFTFCSTASSLVRAPSRSRPRVFSAFLEYLDPSACLPRNKLTRSKPSFLRDPPQLAPLDCAGRTARPEAVRWLVLLDAADVAPRPRTIDLRRGSIRRASTSQAGGPPPVFGRARRCCFISLGFVGLLAAYADAARSGAEGGWGAELLGPETGAMGNPDGREGPTRGGLACKVEASRAFGNRRLTCAEPDKPTIVVVGHVDLCMASLRPEDDDEHRNRPPLPPPSVLTRDNGRWEPSLPPLVGRVWAGKFARKYALPSSSNLTNTSRRQQLLLRAQDPLG